MGHLGQFISNHWGLFAAFVGILILIFLNELYAQKKRGKELSPTATVQMINHDEAVVIDIRNQDLFRQGHIINAVHASKEDFDQGRMNKYKTKPLILVCAQGIQARALSARIRTQGFQQPMVLAGGIAAWVAAGLPLEKPSGKLSSKKSSK